MQRFLFFFHSHFVGAVIVAVVVVGRATRSCSCSPHGRAHEQQSALAFRRQPPPLVAHCLATPLAVLLCCARYPGPVPMTEWRAMAWRGHALRRQTPPPTLSALSALSFSLHRNEKLAQAEPRAERSRVAAHRRTQQKRGESRHSRLRPTERNSHSVNAHALRQLTVSVNHGDERITGNTRAAAAAAKHQQPLNQKE